MDAGINLAKTVRGVMVADNTLLGNLHGVRIQGAPDAPFRGNAITGRTGRRSEAGNGVSVWRPNRKVLIDSRFEGCEIGIHSASSSPPAAMRCRRSSSTRSSLATRRTPIAASPSPPPGPAI